MIVKLQEFNYKFLKYRDLFEFFSKRIGTCEGIKLLFYPANKTLH